MANTFRNIRADGGGGGGSVDSVNGLTGVVVLTKSSIGLSNVNNTSDANKPVSTIQQAALDLKLDIESVPNIEPNNLIGNSTYSYVNPEIRPLQNSPDESFTILQRTVQVDPDSTGYDIGTNGTFASIFNIGFNHLGTSDIGNATYFSTYSQLGNGTDPITVRGLQYWYGFGNIQSGVTVTDSIQGFGIQLAVDAGATIDGYFSGFYDNMDVNCAVESYTSFASNPQLVEVKNNNGFVSFNSNPTIDELTGNASVNAFAFSGNFGSVGIGTGSISGFSANPTITNNNFYNGVYSSTLNVSGGTKWAGYFEGDVNITGSLTFGGALSIGQLTAFGTLNPVVDGGGTPTTVNSLISSINIPASSTTNDADTIGLNTASLVTIGANSTTNMSSIRIFSSLALPSVIETHTGSYLSDIQGGVFALSLSGTSTGGTIETAASARFVAIPNGITTVDKHYGVWSHNPFGNIGTDNWGIYIEDSEKNYIEGALVIGDSDTPTNSSIGLELNSTTKAFVSSRMTTTERNSLTPSEGMIIFNITDGKHQGYDGAIWNDLY